VYENIYFVIRTIYHWLVRMTINLLLVLLKSIFLNLNRLPTRTKYKSLIEQLGHWLNLMV